MCDNVIEKIITIFRKQKKTFKKPKIRIFEVFKNLKVTSTAL